MCEVAKANRSSGTIFLEASHSGNNVYIIVRDDGGGIDVEKIKAKLIDQRFFPSRRRTNYRTNRHLTTSGIPASARPTK